MRRATPYDTPARYSTAWLSSRRSQYRTHGKKESARNIGLLVAKRTPSKSPRMLFIGNSFTQRNNLPDLLAEIAASFDCKVKHDLVTAGGASLRMHWNAGRALERIQSGNYEFVVLQEQSTLPVKNASRMAENVRLFNDAIQLAGAKTVLYMTWARRHAPETQHAITDAYNTIGRECGAIVAPVGLVWEQFRSEYQQPDLFDRDGSHPTLAGSYLAACVFAVTLWGSDVTKVGTGPAALTPDERQMLQAVAWRTRKRKS